MFTKKNLEQIQNQELTPEIINKQLNDFSNGFPLMKLISPAIPHNGIRILSEDEENRFISIFENSLSSGLNALKFVPASGAASRMFKDLYEFLESSKENEHTDKFFNKLEKFAFYNELKAICTSNDKKDIVRNLILNTGLNYGKKPKGLLIFHKYNDRCRTPFEEHLVEAASYCTGSNGVANIHFTVSPEHLEGFETLLRDVNSIYQKRFGIKLNVSFSFQHKSTDTIAVDMNNNPYLDTNGDLVFRPGGHGALIQNLNELDSDLIFIKNIDNVVPDHLKQYTKRYKKALAGLLVTLRNKVFGFLEKLNTKDITTNIELLNSIDIFLRKELCIEFESHFDSALQRVEFYKSKLNRPIRICGMVKNQGEPGGGPFWVLNADNSISLQIVEKAQIDLDNPEQMIIFNKSTHFNPVDIICNTKNYKGEKFDLLKYVDPKTGFISIKSKNGIEMKALELPGLWNGAMSNWNTVFVEVPIETFNPVKTINDLLRSEHQQ